MARYKDSSDRQVTFQTGQGMSVRGTVVELTRHTATFEVYDPAVVLQTSEALRDFQILAGDRAIYSGRAVVSGFVPTGPLALCDARLQDEPQIEDEPPAMLVSGAELQVSYERFVTQWKGQPARGAGKGIGRERRAANHRDVQFSPRAI